MAVEDLASIQTLDMEVEQEVIVLVLVLMVSIMVSTMVLIHMVDKVEQVLDNLIKTLVDKAIIEGAHNTMQQVRIQQQRKLKNLPNNCPMYLPYPPQTPKEHGIWGGTLLFVMKADWHSNIYFYVFSVLSFSVELHFLHQCDFVFLLFTIKDSYFSFSFSIKMMYFVLWFLLMDNKRKKQNNFKLTNCCDNNNAVKKCPWKSPLYFIFAFNPIPAIFLHCFQNAILKFLLEKEN